MSGRSLRLHLPQRPRLAGGRRALALAASLAALLAAPDGVAAQSQSQSAAESASVSLTPSIGETVGPVTGLQLPRYVSLKATHANMRRGPGMSHRVDWELLKHGMPLLITAEYGHWRQVMDQDGASGWVHYSMLSGVRTAISRPEVTELHGEPDAGSPITAKAGPGVILQVEACERDWCEVERDGAGGWAPKTALWGVDPSEVFD